MSVALTPPNWRDTASFMRIRHALLALLISALLGACATTTENESQTRPIGENSLSEREMRRALSGAVDFTRHVKPVLEAKCVACHNADGLPGRLNLSSREAAVRSGALGVFIVPGKPDQSLLVTQIASAPAHLKAMPPVGQQVTDQEIAVLRRWIAQGAAWPAGPAGVLATGY